MAEDHVCLYSTEVHWSAEGPPYPKLIIYCKCGKFTSVDTPSGFFNNSKKPLVEVSNEALS
jgi:hypothetical protein